MHMWTTRFLVSVVLSYRYCKELAPRAWITLAKGKDFTMKKNTGPSRLPVTNSSPVLLLRNHLGSVWAFWLGGRATSALYISQSAHPCFGIALDYLKVSVVFVSGSGSGWHEVHRTHHLHHCSRASWACVVAYGMVLSDPAVPLVIAPRGCCSV